MITMPIKRAKVGLVSGGPEKAVEERTQNFQDLVWRRSGERLELAIELGIQTSVDSS